MRKVGIEPTGDPFQLVRLVDTITRGRLKPVLPQGFLDSSEKEQFERALADAILVEPLGFFVLRENSPSTRLAARNYLFSRPLLPREIDEPLDARPGALELLVRYADAIQEGRDDETWQDRNILAAGMARDAIMGWGQQPLLGDRPRPALLNELIGSLARALPDWSRRAGTVSVKEIQIAQEELIRRGAALVLTTPSTGDGISAVGARPLGVRESEIGIWRRPEHIETLRIEAMREAESAVYSYSIDHRPVFASAHVRPSIRYVVETAARHAYSLGVLSLPGVKTAILHPPPVTPASLRAIFQILDGGDSRESISIDPREL
jgi:hypothetical protein